MKKFKKRFNEFRELLLSPELRILPGNIAYMLTFSLIPILSMMIYVLITFNLSTNLITDFINSTFPVGISKLLEPIFNTNITQNVNDYEKLENLLRDKDYVDDIRNFFNIHTAQNIKLEQNSKARKLIRGRR